MEHTVISIESLLKALKDLREAFVIAVGDKSPFAKEALARVDALARIELAEPIPGSQSMLVGDHRYTMTASPLSLAQVVQVPYGASLSIGVQGISLGQRFAVIDAERRYVVEIQMNSDNTAVEKIIVPTGVPNMKYEIHGREIFAKIEENTGYPAAEEYRKNLEEWKRNFDEDIKRAQDGRGT